MKHLLARLYRRIGIHAAPPGTALYMLHAALYRIMRRRPLRLAPGAQYRRGRYGAVRYYDIARQRQIRPVDGLALIFFIGAGDYLMATPLIRALHSAHPDLPIYAYVSSSTDNVSSALVYDLVKVNPLVDRVFRYDGRPRDVWTDYDFARALDDIPPKFLPLPVIYDVDPCVLHRTTSLLETFGLPVDLPLPVPIAYDAPLSSAANSILGRIQNKVAYTAPKGVVCLQLETRSSGYEYPFARQLAAELLKRGYIVVNFSPTGWDDPAVVNIDINTISPPDTIELLRALRRDAPGVSVISANSLLWPISAALHIPNLGLHVFEDPSMHQYHYPNIFVLTRFFYPRLSPFHQFQASAGTFAPRTSSDGLTLFSDYKPNFVLRCFEAMLARIAGSTCETTAAPQCRQLALS